MSNLAWHNLLPILVFLLLMVLIFWGTIIRPQVQAQRRHEALIKDLKVGDRIITAGGIHGQIVKLTEDTFTLEIAPGVRVVFDRRAVRKRQE